MLKPLGKKSMVLPSPQSCLEEWSAQAQRHPMTVSMTMAHVTPNGAALRIQQRYRLYQQKVRLLLKKSADQTSTQSTTPTQSHENVVKAGGGAVGRGVRGSSMALAVAVKARQQNDTEAETHVMVKQNSNSSSTAHLSVSYGASEKRTEQPQTWTSAEWTLSNPKQLQLWDEPEQDNNHLGRKVIDDSASISPWKEKCTKMLQDSSDVQARYGACEDEDDTVTVLVEESVASRRKHGFVNVMHPSWLLSSMEDRCAATAASLGARSASSALTVADIRHTVLDLVFICRSGVDVNLHGRPPSSVSTHHQNLLVRVAEAGYDIGELTAEELQRRVTRIFHGLKSDMFMPAVRCLGWILTKTWRMLFHGLHLDVDSLHRLRDVLEQHANGNVSVVFTPTHKTHLDYLIISYLCFAYGIPLPRIAAGNNLDLPLIGSFLRANGSFFIRRSFRNDPLYKEVLQHYVHELLNDGNPLEVFIEGGRSRHGRVCKPRLGFLSMFSEYVKSHQNEDDGLRKNILLVPISLDYDKVFEVEEYANQLLGKPKEMESLRGFFNSVWDLFFLRCGHSYVRFGEPLLMTAQSSLEATAEELAIRQQTCGTITSTAIVSALLMWRRGYATKEMLEMRTIWLVQELEARGANVAHVEDEDIVPHALSVLNVRTLPNGVVQPQLKFPVRALELGFYRNHLLHIFLPEIALIGAIDGFVRQLKNRHPDGQMEKIVLKKSDILKDATLIWHFLRHICRHEAINLADLLDQFVFEASELEESEASTKLFHVDMRRWKVSKRVGFVLSLHWSLMDTLWLSCQGLWNLMTSEKSDKTDSNVVRNIQVLAKTLFVQHELAHAEALCSESIKQALAFLIEQGFVNNNESSTDGRFRVLRLCQSEDALASLCQQVNCWRKPKSFLWKPDQPPRNLSRQETQELIRRATTQQSSSRGIYEKWMAPSSSSSSFL